MVSLSCKDLGMAACVFVAEADTERHVKNRMFEHVRDEHPELIAGITDEARRQLESTMDAAIRRSEAA